MTTSPIEATAGLDRRVGENVHTLMFRTGLSARRLAPFLGVSHPTLGKKINGTNPWTLVEVVALADYFGVTLAEMTTALPTHEEWEGRWSVRHQGLEPRTRCLGASTLTGRVYDLAAYRQAVAS